MAERKKPETKVLGDASSTPLTRRAKAAQVPDEVHQLDLSGTSGVTINKSALKNAALRGPAEPLVEVIELVLGDHLPEDHEDVPKIKPFKGSGNFPNLHDVKRWLESLEKTQDRDGFRFAVTVWATAKARIG